MKNDQPQILITNANMFDGIRTLRGWDLSGVTNDPEDSSDR